MLNRSERGAAYQRLYKTSAWTKARKAFLALHPLCERCQDNGRITAATVVHHLIPHKGDELLFFDPSHWQALCAPCHDRDAQGEEARGYSNEIGIDGWPTCSNHPANRVK